MLNGAILYYDEMSAEENPGPKNVPMKECTYAATMGVVREGQCRR